MVTRMQKIGLSKTGLTVPMRGGESAYFNYFWLRDNCPTSWDPETRDRSFDIFAEPDTLHPLSAQIEGDALVVTWAHDGHVSRYSLTWLTRWAKGDGRIDPAALPRNYWLGDHHDRLQRFTMQALRSDPRAITNWIEALLIDGIAVVDELSNSDQALSELASLAGKVRAAYCGQYFDVAAKANPTASSSTAGPLEMHTDIPAEELAPGVQFLHCRSNSVEGGDTLFVDGGTVANDLRSSSPRDFELLSRLTVPFRVHHDGYDMRARQRVIELDENGAVAGVTMSQHMADVFDLPQKTLDEYYPAFHRFGNMLKERKYAMRLRFKPGECLVFDNHRIVHGRDAYAAQSGQRHLRGCYVDRGELRSTYRALKAGGERNRWTQPAEVAG